MDYAPLAIRRLLMNPKTPNRTKNDKAISTRIARMSPTAKAILLCLFLLRAFFVLFSYWKLTLYNMLNIYTLRQF
jgi:hypothetical protein